MRKRPILQPLTKPIREVSPLDPAQTDGIRYRIQRRRRTAAGTNPYEASDPARSTDVADVLGLPPAVACECQAFDGLLGDVFMPTDDLRFFILRQEIAESSTLMKRLLDEQRVRQEDVVRAFLRLAIRRCPFDGTIVDPSLTWAPALPDPDEGLLCCEWMARAVLSGRAHAPSPRGGFLLPQFARASGQTVPFFCCPRCNANFI